MSALDPEYRTRQQIALSLGWGNVPPLDILVRDIRARDAGARVLTKRVEALEAALQRIADGDYPTDPHGHVRIARAALGDAP